MNQTRSKTPTLRFKGCDTSAAASNSSCASCGCVSFKSTTVARYDEQGNCASPGQISCETQWQMRDCLKLAFCEFLSCLGNQMCVDSKFEMPVDAATGETKTVGEVLLCCLGESFCTVLHCLPEAICGPRQDNDCIPPPALECNYAVEEKD